MICAGLATTRVWTASGAGTASASCCFVGDFTTRVVRGPRRTGAGSMVCRGRIRPTGVVVDDYLLAIDHLEARLMELDAQLVAVAGTDPYREPVGWLRCFRGIDTLTVVLLLAELHDVQRFPTARALMAYPGLVPGEHSSGDRHRRGPITKTGNSLAWPLVMEAAWHYRHRPGVSQSLAQRWSGQPWRMIALAGKAQQRLCRRFRRLVRAQAGSDRDGGRCARDRRVSVGGLASGGGVIGNCSTLGAHSQPRPSLNRA